MFKIFKMLILVRINVQQFRRGSDQMFLGVAAYINHDCSPNCKFLSEAGLDGASVQVGGFVPLV